MDGKLDFEPSVVVNSFNSGLRLIYRDFRKRKAKSPVLLPQWGGSVDAVSLAVVATIGQVIFKNGDLLQCYSTDRG